MEGQWEVDNETRLSIPWHELIIPKLLGLFQAVKVDELIEHDHIPVRYGGPNHHAAYDDSSRIRHKLPKSYVQMVEKLHYERMNRKSEAAQECSLIKQTLP